MLAPPPRARRAPERPPQLRIGGEPPQRQPQRVILVEDIECDADGIRDPRTRYLTDLGARTCDLGKVHGPRSRIQRSETREVKEIGDDRRTAGGEGTQPGTRRFARGWP